MNSALQKLCRLLSGSRKLFVLSGAGCSTESGIPDYRDHNGDWKQRQPVQYQDFISRPQTRQRYWARSLVGWERFAAAQPGATHKALARLEHHGLIHHLVTQNVDRLHQRAGSRAVIDLHGRLDTVECMDCRRHSRRAALQQRLRAANPHCANAAAITAPDGDAHLEGRWHRGFQVPECEQCGGILKPSVVFFGESVPAHRVARAFAALEESDAMLVVGSSLKVFSGYRFCTRAVQLGIPIMAINIGLTRADELFTIKVERASGDTLETLARALGA